MTTESRVFLLLVFVSILIRWIRHGIVTTLVPGMATSNAAHAHPQAPPRSPLIHCLDGVGRATGHVTAVVAEKGADQQLIAPHQFDKDLLEHPAPTTAWALDHSRTTAGLSDRMH